MPKHCAVQVHTSDTALNHAEKASAALSASPHSFVNTTNDNKIHFQLKYIDGIQHNEETIPLGFLLKSHSTTSRSLEYDSYCTLKKKKLHLVPENSLRVWSHCAHSSILSCA